MIKKNIFLAAIEYFEHNNINYCVLGDIQQFPNNIGSDVDLVIDTNSFNDLNQILSDFVSQYDLAICNVLEHEIEGKYFIIGSNQPENETLEVLALDFCCNYMRQGRIILTSETLLHNRQKITHNNVSFYVCDTPIAFCYYFIKKVEKNSLNEFQFHYLLNLWINNTEKITQQLDALFDKNNVERITRAFETKDISLFSKEFLKKLHTETNQKFKISFVNRILDLKRKIKRIVKPTGLVIAIYGCDGSGKSTLINKLISDPKDYEMFRGYSYHHLYPSKVNKSSVVSNPHEQKPRNKILSNIKLIYFFIKYTKGYYQIIYPQKIRSKIVIFDRYYYDILVDPKRYRHNGSSWLTKLIGYLIPSPDLTFIIDAPTDILQKRKQEVSYEESDRQRKAYLELKNRIPNSHIIDNSINLNDAVYTLKKEICHFLIKRQANK